MGAHSLAEAFVRNAERAPDKLCLHFEGEEWTYRRLRDDTALSAEKVVDYCRGIQEAARGSVCGRFAAQRSG